MKKIIDSITLRCISHATEDLEKVKDALEFISGRRDFEEIRTKGYHGNEIIILQVEIRKQSEIVEFWRHLADMGVVDEILPILGEIVDDDGVLHLRFDKQEAYLGRVAIATGGDTIALRMKILSYPRSRDAAIKNFEEFLSRIRC